MRPTRAVALCFLTLFAARPSSADVWLLVNEAIGYGGEMNGGGHAAVYLSNICSDDVVSVRLCRSAEDRGVVLSTYPDFLPEKSPYWMAVPLNVYLYGVEDLGEAPIVGSPVIYEFLQKQFAHRRLEHLLGPVEDTLPDGEWVSLVGNTLSRNVYAFHLTTTPDQDAQVVGVLTNVQHRRRFDLSYNNCSDFARLILNTYFPGAVHRDALNDFTFSTPKATARTLTSYASKHPELGFEVTKYRQVEGTMLRSFPNRDLSEKMVVSKKYLALTFFASPYVTAALGGLYLTTARFSVEGEYERSRRADIGATTPSAAAAPSLSTGVRASRTSGVSTGVKGSSRPDYKQAFDRLASEAVERGLFASRKGMTRFPADLETLGVPEYSDRDGLRMRLRVNGETKYVGLTRASLVTPSSDPSLSYQLMLSVFAGELDSGGTHRPTANELTEDWRLLTEIHDREGIFPDQKMSLVCAKDVRCEPPPRRSVFWRIVTFITH